MSEKRFVREASTWERERRYITGLTTAPRPSEWIARSHVVVPAVKGDYRSDARRCSRRTWCMFRRGRIPDQRVGENERHRGLGPAQDFANEMKSSKAEFDGLASCCKARDFMDATSDAHLRLARVTIKSNPRLWTSSPPTSSPSTCLWFFQQELVPSSRLTRTRSQASRSISPPSLRRAQPHWRRLCRRIDAPNTVPITDGTANHYSDDTHGPHERRRLNQ